MGSPDEFLQASVHKDDAQPEYQDEEENEVQESRGLGTESPLRERVQRRFHAKSEELGSRRDEDTEGNFVQTQSAISYNAGRSKQPIAMYRIVVREKIT